MNESIGNAALFYLAITFVIILSGLFVGSLAYTKAYKVKNKIIEEIEREGEHTSPTENVYNDDVETRIEQWLAGTTQNGQRGIGYKKNGRKYNNCPRYKGNDAINQIEDYHYCIYRISTCDKKNTCTADSNNDNSCKCDTYYHVITYMYFDFPLVEEFPIPVTGDTMSFVKIDS